MAERMVEGDNIGRVVSLSGSKVIGLLKGSRVNGAAPLQIGSLIKMQATDTTVFGIVNGLSIPIPTQEETDDELRIAEMELVGEVPDQDNGNGTSFRRGVSTSPSLGDHVFGATQEDIGMIYARPDSMAIEVGTLHQGDNLPVYVVVDNLLGKHFAILGSTGTGKSCAVSLILHGILEQHSNAHVVLLDPHGEYANAFKENAENIDPNDLQLPYWLMNFEEFVEVVFGAESGELVAETSLLRDLIQQSKMAMMGDEENSHAVTVDTPVPYKMGDLMRIIDETMGRLDNRNDIGPYQRIRNRLNALQSDRRYAFMFPSSVIVRDNMAAILSRIFRIPVDGKPISILNLSGVPSEVLNVVVSVLCRMTFDFATWSDQDTPILLVCEEAHRYATSNPAEGFEPTVRSLSRIAKEGRKYGVSLGIISQRPAELATSVPSQCNSIFAMRLTNENDQDIVRATLSDAGAALLDSLPALGNAEAIVVGDAVSVPMRLRFNELDANFLPKSATAEFSSNWSHDGATEETLQLVVDRWRRQRR